MSIHDATGQAALRLARDELARIERQIGTGSARDAAGRWSPARARDLNQLRHAQAVCNRRIVELQAA